MGVTVLLRNLPSLGEIRLAVLTRFRGQVMRSFLPGIGRVGPGKRDYTSQSEIIVW